MRVLTLRGPLAAAAILLLATAVSAQDALPAPPTRTQVETHADLSGLDGLDVDPRTGGVTLTRTDLVVGEGELAYRVTRNYRPWGGDLLNCGLNWASSLDLHLDLAESRASASFQDETGHRHFFRRDAKGRLASVEGAQARLEELADGFSLRGLGDGRVYRFDARGWLISREGPSGLRLRYRYDEQHRLLLIEGPWGQLQFERDARGVLASITGPGVRVRYARDADANLIKVTRELARAHETYGYDGAGRLSWLGEAQAMISYDSEGRAVFLGGPARYPSTIRYSQGEEPWDREVQITHRGETQIYRFSADDRQLEHVGPRGEITQREVDERGRLIRLTGPDGRTVRRSYDELGHLVSETGPQGTVRYLYQHRLSDRPTRIRLADGREVGFDYDVRGNVTSLSAPGGALTRYGYDAAGRLIKITDPRGAVSDLLRDEHGYVIQVDESGRGTTQFLRDEAGRLTKVKRPDGRVVEIEQGADGKTTRISDALGLINLVEHDDRQRVTHLVDEHGNDYRYAYGPLGDLLTVTNHGQPHLVFVYDEHGQVVEVRDAVGNPTKFERPDPSTLVVSDPSAGTRRIQTDVLGRVVSEERGGKSFRFEYDATTGNLVARHTPGGADRFSYDAGGRVIAMEGPQGGFGFRYDAAGRLAELTNSKLGRSVSYGYDAAGDRTSMTLPWGEVGYERDVQGRLTGLNLPGEQKIAIELHPDGRRKEVRYPNGVTTRFFYQRSRLKAVVTSKVTSAGTSKDEEELDRRVYGYDERGRVAWVENHAKERTTYTHDAQGRLTGAKGPAGEVSYRYDAAGNRVAELRGEAETSYTISAGNRVASRKDKSGEVRYQYNEEGSLLSREDASGITRYTYDHDQKLVEVKSPDGASVRYGYAPNGSRLWREDAEGREYYLHDLGHTVGVLDREGKLKESFFHGEGDDDVLSAQRGEDRYYYHYDLVRSVTSLTGAEGKVAARYGYDAFGRSTLAEGAAAAWNPHRYTSRTLDQDTGLYDYRARTYDTELGRFTTPDPAGLMGGTNLYAYVGNAPLNFNDPYGLWPDWLDRKVEATRAWVDTNVVSPVANGVSAAASWTKENVIDPAGEALATTARNTVAFGRGFVNGTVGVVKGVVQMVAHPIETGKALWHAVTHFDETKEMFKAKWAEYKDAWANDPEKFWEMTGHLTAEVAFAVVGPKGVTAVVNAASKTATVARIASTTARVSRVVTSPVARVASRSAGTLGRTFPRAAKVVRNGQVLNRARNIENLRRAAEGGNVFRRTARRVGYAGKDVWNGARLAATRPGAFTVYSGIRTSRAARALIAANARGAWKMTKNGAIPVWAAFKDNITDGLNAYANQDEALKDVRARTRSFLDDADSLSPEELARRIEEIGGVYGTYRNRLLQPVHEEDLRLDAALTELDRKVAAGEIPDNTLDSRLNAMLEEYGRRRHNILTGIYDGNREAEHDMFSPSINRTVSFQDEIDLLEAAKARSRDALSKSLLDARIKDLQELMAYEYELFRRGDHDVLIAGIAGPPRPVDGGDPFVGQPAAAPVGSEGDSDEYHPGMLDSLEEALRIGGER